MATVPASLTLLGLLKLVGPLSSHTWDQGVCQRMVSDAVNRNCCAELCAPDPDNNGVNKLCMDNCFSEYQGNALSFDLPLQAMPEPKENLFFKTKSKH